MVKLQKVGYSPLCARKQPSAYTLDLYEWAIQEQNVCDQNCSGDIENKENDKSQQGGVAKCASQLNQLLELWDQMSPMQRDQMPLSLSQYAPTIAVLPEMETLLPKYSYAPPSLGTSLKSSYITGVCA